MARHRPRTSSSAWTPSTFGAPGGPGFLGVNEVLSRKPRKARILSCLFVLFFQKATGSGL